MVYLYGILEVIIKVFFQMINDRVMVRCIGLMVMYIVVNGNKEYNMVRVNYL
jgi:hypothetical protein